MKNSLLMFTNLYTGTKVAFNAEHLTTIAPIGQNGDGGAILYGVGCPDAGIQVKEPYGQVLETVGSWFQSNAATGIRA